MVTLNSIEQLAGKLAEFIIKLKDENEQLKKEAALLRNKVSEKELEHIRETKEFQRNIELLEREKMALQKDKAQLDSQVKSVYDKLNALLPEELESGRNS